MGSSTGSRFGKLEPKTKMNLAQVLIQIEIIYKIDNPYSQTNNEMVRIWYFLYLVLFTTVCTRICIISGLEYLQAAACIS